jgi:hypothetical protein
VHEQHEATPTKPVVPPRPRLSDRFTSEPSDPIQLTGAQHASTEMLRPSIPPRPGSFAARDASAAYALASGQSGHAVLAIPARPSLPVRSFMSSSSQPSQPSPPSPPPPPPR